MYVNGLIVGLVDDCDKFFTMFNVFAGMYITLLPAMSFYVSMSTSKLPTVKMSTKWRTMST
jgi:hypothetical protein